MPAIWIYSEDASVAEQLIAPARTLASAAQPICAIVLDQQGVERLLPYGLNVIYKLTGENSWPESYAAAIAKLAAQEKPDIMLIGGTLRGKDVAAKAAAILGAGLVSDAFAIHRSGDAFETQRLMYGGLAVCTETTLPTALVTIPPRCFEAPETSLSLAASVLEVTVQTEGRVQVGAVCPIERQGADISCADKIVSVGRGVAKQEDMAIARELAEALGAELGCTRGIAEDYHWLPVERYIGLSGQKVKPSLYLSLGVSGQVQHVAGIRDAKVIVAIDKNEDAPIFAAADYGIIGDLYEIAPLLAQAIQAAKPK